MRAYSHLPSFPAYFSLIFLPDSSLNQNWHGFFIILGKVVKQVEK